MTSSNFQNLTARGYLPNHMWDLVFDKMTLIDRMKSTAVSKLWFSQIISENNEWGCTLKNSKGQKNIAPLLMIPDQDQYNFYCVSRSKVLNFYLRDNIVFNRRFCGSSHGWLIFGEKGSKLNHFNVTLFNPFSNKTISLPPLIPWDEEFDFRDKYPYKIEKAILSADPDLYSDNYMVAAIMRGNFGMFVYLSKERSWTFYFLRHVDLELLADVIFHEGTFYVVDEFMGLGRVDLISNNIEEEEQGSIVVPSYHDQYLNDRELFELYVLNRDFRVKPYIVESKSGDLLLVRKFYGKNFDGEKGILNTNLGLKIEICKMESSKEEGATNWVEVDALGEEALFLGDNHSMSIWACESIVCKPNCIYFVHDEFHLELNPTHGPCYMAVCNLEDRTIEKHYMPTPGKKLTTCPIWISPPIPGAREWN